MLIVNEKLLPQPAESRDITGNTVNSQRNGMSLQLNVERSIDIIPQLISAIFECSKESISSLKSKQLLWQDHPDNIQHTIAHIPPEITSTIVATKKSRFSDD